MKAARYYGPRDVRIEDVSVPEPKDNQVLVEIAWCGICGSDLKNYTTGGYGTPTHDRPDIHTGDCLPVTLGHEACGKVAQTTPGCPFEVGQAVMIDPRLRCSDCEFCLTDRSNLCNKPGFIGLSGGGGGGLSQYVAVNWQECYPIPTSLLDHAALIEPLCVARRGMRRSRLEHWQDKTALVLGGGPIGQAMLYNLRAAGCPDIFCSEPTALRREQVAAIGCTALDPTSIDVVEALMNKTGTGVDVVFDCAGVPPALKVGMQALRKQGTYVMIASWDKPIGFDLALWMGKEITLEASLAYRDADFKSVVDDFIGGHFQGIEQMITNRIKLDNVVAEGFEALLEGKADCTKILVSPK